MMRFSIYAIAQKERMSLLKAPGSSSLHLNGRCTINGGGSPNVCNKMIHKGFLGSFSSVYVVDEILHRWHTSGVLAAYWRWQYAMVANDTGMASYRGRSGESIEGRQSVAAPLASDFCKSDHLQLSISHVWPFNLVIKCCQGNSRDNGP